MDTELRPLTLGDTVDIAFDLYKQNFALFVGVVAIIHVPMSIAIQWVTYAFQLDKMVGNQSPKTEEQIGALFAAMGIFSLIMLVYSGLYILQSAALSFAAGERYFGRKTSIGAAWLKTGSAFPQLCGSWLMITIVVGIVGTGVMWVSAIILVMIMGAFGAGGAPLSDVMTFMVGLGVVLAPTVVIVTIGVWIAVFVNQVIVLENHGAINAIMRNVSLVRGGFWRVLAATLLLMILWGTLGAAIQVSMDWFLKLFVFSWLHAGTLVQRIVQGTWESLVSLCIQPFVTIALTVLYFERRVRRDGLDLAILSRRLVPRSSPISEITPAI